MEYVIAQSPEFGAVIACDLEVVKVTQTEKIESSFKAEGGGGKIGTYNMPIAGKVVSGTIKPIEVSHSQKSKTHTSFWLKLPSGGETIIEQNNETVRAREGNTMRVLNFCPPNSDPILLGYGCVELNEYFHAGVGREIVEKLLGEKPSCTQDEAVSNLGALTKLAAILLCIPFGYGISKLLIAIDRGNNGIYYFLGAWSAFIFFKIVWAFSNFLDKKIEGANTERRNSERMQPVLDWENRRANLQHWLTSAFESAKTLETT